MLRISVTLLGLVFPAHGAPPPRASNARKFDGGLASAAPSAPAAAGSADSAAVTALVPAASGAFLWHALPPAGGGSNDADFPGDAASKSSTSGGAAHSMSTVEDHFESR